MTYQNKFKCVSKLWRKLGWPGKSVYNELYGTMKKRGLLEPKTKSYAKSLVSDDDWLIICHNVAWTAARAAERAALKLAA